MKASDLFVECLQNEGVEYIFGIAGEENLDLLESLRKSKIKFIVTRHEQAAGFMAATYGRLTGKTGVCLSTLGPGATNFITATAFAFLGGMPVLFITGQKPIKKSKQARFQIINVVRMMEPITKFSRQIVNANNIPSLIRECFRVAEHEKPGPVHLELPEDIAADQVDRKPFLPTTILEPRAPLSEINKAARMIESASQPLVCIASGANRHENSSALNDFISSTGLYFFNTQMGKGVVDELSPQFLGTAALSEHDYLHCAIERSDLIINVGHDVSEKPPFIMHEDSTKVIHISYFPALTDDVYFPQAEVIGCMSTNLRELAKSLSGSKSFDLNYFTRMKSEIEKNVFALPKLNNFPSTPQQIVRDVQESMPKKSILSLDNGMYKIWFARNYKAPAPNSILLDNALATMGAGLPSAIAAKIVEPNKTVMAICGDGGFMMNSQELETALRLKLDLIVLILRDDAFGMIKWKQEGMSLKSFGLDFNNPDFVDYAKSYGAFGHRVTKAYELNTIIKSAIIKGGVHLIESPIDYSENEKVLLSELRNKTCLL